MRQILRYTPPLFLAINGAVLALDNAAGTPPGLFNVLAVLACSLYMVGTAAETNGRG